MSLNRRTFVLGMGMTAAYATSTFAATPKLSKSIVETTEGRVRGLDLGNVIAFKGLHYGGDTSGAQRFKPPTAPAKWAGVRAAIDYGPTAPHLRVRQPRTGFSTLFHTPIAQSEDCLVLNIWTPAPDRAKRPVMVWLHGGAFTVGSGSGPNVDGRFLAPLHDVVVVTLNHRLNVLGYLDVGALDPGFEGSVNAGMLDIIAALEWIKRNIEMFGGDPSRVMIFGESGGSLKTATMLAMPGGKGLFHRAAMQSGAYLHARNREDSTRTVELVLKAFELPRERARELQKIPYHALADAVVKLGPKVGFYSTVDGVTMTHHPFDPVPAPSAIDIPLIIGFNRTEITLINSVDTGSFDLDEAGYTARLNAVFTPTEAKEVAAVYAARYPNASFTERWFMIGTDQWLFVGSAKIAERKTAAGGAPAWLYRFDWRTPVEGGKWRSPHTLEIPFVFETVRDPKLSPFVGPSPDLALSTRMAGAWAAFARTGNPNNPGLPQWKPYDASSRMTMIFDSETKALADPCAPERVLMDKIAFTGTTAGRGDRALAARSVLAQRSAENEK